MVYVCRSEDSLEESVLFCYVGPRDWTHVDRRGAESLYPLSRLNQSPFVAYVSVNQNQNLKELEAHV